MTIHFPKGHFPGSSSTYDRHVKHAPETSSKGLRRRIEDLVGITGMRNSRNRCTWRETIITPLKICCSPHALSILIYEAMVFGFSVGIHVTNVVFFGEPKPLGYGLSQIAIAGLYGTPLVRSSLVLI